MRDCENYRIWLLNDSGYSQAYSSLMYGMFRKSLDYAVTLQFLNENISKEQKQFKKENQSFLTGQKKNLKKFWQKFIKMISTNICVFNDLAILHDWCSCKRRISIIGMTWTSNVKVEGSSHLGNDKSKRFYSETLHKN